MNDDLLPYFLAEGRELVERAAEALFDLEGDGASGDAVERAFRAVHTLKGSAGLFDMAELGALLHAAEDELEGARKPDAPPPATAPLLETLRETERWLDAVDADGAVPAERRQAAAALAARFAAGGRAEKAPDAVADQNPAARTLRVEASLIDAVADWLDQVLVARGVLTHETEKALGDKAPTALAAAEFALDQTLSALREAVARMRLAPLRRLFGPLPRQVRDMAQALGKQAELSISGEQVAVDKLVLDGLYEPLIHLLRNAVDHGIEAPEARRAAGKPERGRIRLSAAPRGDVAVIEVADDGAGLDLARIRDAAIERGLIGADETLSERETTELIFRPGFSTAREVTDISGRGVGLDAVRAALARIGGRVEIESRPGQGALARIAAPLRTLLTRVAVFDVDGERYATPLDAIGEIVRISRGEISQVRAGEAAVVRGETLPLLRLRRIFGCAPDDADPLTVLVVATPGGRVGFVVDAVEKVVQAPVQAASQLLASLPGVTGSLLQGDGRVLLLLDLAALIL